MSESFYDKVEKETFYEYDHVIDSINSAEHVGSCFELMHPQVQINIVANACNRLTNVAISLFSSIYQNESHKFNDKQNMAIRNVLNNKKAFYDSLLQDINTLNKQFDKYQLIYESEISKYNNIKEKMSSVGGATIGGTIGSMFGPIGTVVGGIAGSILHTDKHKRELECMCENLLIENQNIFNATAEHMNKVLEKFYSNIDEYEKVCDGERDKCSWC